MSEQELRERLRRVVPEAPELDPSSLAASGRQARTRRRVFVGLGVVAAGAAVAAAAAGLQGFADRGPDPVAGPSTAEVYTTVPCPAQLPGLDDANLTFPDLDTVVGVRACGDASEFGDGDLRNDPAPSYPLTPDALVGGVPVFVDAVRGLPEPDPGRCATLSYVVTRASLALLLDDGSTVLVGQPFCGATVLDGQEVDPSEVVLAYLEALDEQRDVSAYGTDAPPLTCDVRESYSPAKPGRELVVTALDCSDPRRGAPITGDALDLLRDAWAHPEPVTERNDESGANTCTELAQKPDEVFLATDRGDVVRLFVSPCGYLVLDGWRPGESTQIPVTIEDLEQAR